MKKRFILLIDLSEHAANLIKYACDWSTQVHAEIILVHQSIVLVPSLADKESRELITQHTNAEALQELRSLAHNIIPSTVHVSYLVSEKSLQQMLQELLSERFDNLIFTGIKETGLLKKLFMGSVALQVIDGVENAVVAIPKEMDRYSHERIYVAATEKHPLNVEELTRFLHFIDRENTHITFFYLAKPNESTEGEEEHLRQLSEMFADRFHTDHAIYEGNDPFEDIRKVINDRIEELLVVQRGSRLLTDQLFRKFLINELVYEGQTPLIVLP